MPVIETITGVAGVVVFAIEAAQKLTDLVSEVKNVPDDIRDLGANLSSLISILDSAKTLCSKEEFKDADPLLAHNLRQCIQQCGVTSESLYDELAKFKDNSTGKRNFARRVTWIWHKNERQRIKTRLFESRDNADTAILVMNGYISGKGYHLIRSDIAALYEVLDRNSKPARRAERYKFRRKIDDDLRTVTETDDRVEVYIRGLEVATVPDTAPAIEPILDDTSELDNLPESRSQSTLIQAVLAGDQNAVRELLSSGGPLTPRSPDGQTALHVCIGYNDRAIAELLLNYNSSTINITNMDGLTPIQMAMQKQSWTLASLLVEQGCSMEDFPAMLFEAVRQHTGDFSDIRPVIHALAKRFSNNPGPFPLVHLAIQEDNPKCLALLLEEGFDANTPEAETDIFPLQVGVILERVDHVKLLLKHGALLNRDISPNKNHSFQPYHDREYHKSQWFRNNSWVSLLRVSRDYKSNQGPTMFRLLLDNGEDPQFGRAKSNVHLLGMCAGSYWVYAEQLINAGTDVRARNPRGYTAMYWAANCNNVRMINLLLDKGADINAKLEPNVGGYTPFHAAAMFNRPDVARVLIKRGADVRLTDAKGLTALQLAESKGNSHNGIVSMMKKAIEERNTL